ncbi:MAG: hypothetical protein QG622_2562 [Actinomycetota bacterium]|nr:hypothetical protein [Actinomycetota bacterium]
MVIDTEVDEPARGWLNPVRRVEATIPDLWAGCIRMRRRTSDDGERGTR